LFVHKFAAYWRWYTNQKEIKHSAREYKVQVFQEVDNRGKKCKDAMDIIYTSFTGV
jgi:hypothetical protein